MSNDNKNMNHDKKNPWAHHVVGVFSLGALDVNHWGGVIPAFQAASGWNQARTLAGCVVVPAVGYGVYKIARNFALPFVIETVLQDLPVETGPSDGTPPCLGPEMGGETSDTSVEVSDVGTDANNGLESGDGSEKPGTGSET